MDIFEAIEMRRSVRRFKPDIPRLEDIKTIIDSARLAPSSTNAQMWHYLVVFNSDVKAAMKQAIIDTYDEMLNWEEAKDKESKLVYYRDYSTFFTDAPVNIAVLMEPKTSVIEDILRERKLAESEILRMRPSPGLLSIGASIENLSLAAHALGYGSCWLTAPIYAYEKLEKVLKVKPPYQLVSLLCLGVPEEKITPSPPKKELSDIMTIIK